MSIQIFFLQDAITYLANEQHELNRLRQETYVYSYGAIIAPVAITFMSNLTTGAITDTLIFLGAPYIFCSLPDIIQKALSTCITIYNAYKHSISSLTTVSLGYIITKTINQMSWQNNNKMLRDEINALLLLLIDINLPRVSIIQNADRILEKNISKSINTFFFSNESILIEKKSTNLTDKIDDIDGEIEINNDLKSNNDSIKKAEMLDIDDKIEELNLLKKSNNDFDDIIESKSNSGNNFQQFDGNFNSLLSQQDNNELKNISNTNKYLPKLSNKDILSDKWVNLSPVDRQWEIHKHALRLSKAVYENYIPKNFTLCKDLCFYNQSSGLKFNGYRHIESDVIYLAFKGTSLIETDRNIYSLDHRDIITDLMLIITGRPSTASKNLIQNIKSLIEKNPTKQIILTGHSLGAALASFVSEHTGLPAIVFDNPGLRGYEYKLSNVISYQSRNNSINQFNQYINDNGGKKAQYGHKIRLPFISDTCRIFSSIPILGGLFSHLLFYIEKSFKKHMDDRKLRGLGPCGHESYIYNLPIYPAEHDLSFRT